MRNILQPLKKTALSALVLAGLGAADMNAQINTLWERSASTAGKPAWMGASTERGIAWGKVDDGTGNMVNRVLVASRNAPVSIRLLNDTTGADAGSLDASGLTGGLFALNDVEVSDDGVIFAGNMTTSAAANAFKVYMWSNLTSSPVEVINFTTADVQRLGDKFLVTGRYADKTAVVWAASATTGKIYKFTQDAVSGSFNAVPEVIELSDNATASSANVAVLPNGDFYHKGHGSFIKKYSATGTLIGTIPSSVNGTGGSGIKYVGTVGSSEFIAVIHHGASQEFGRIIEIPSGDPALAVVYASTPNLGSAASSGTGDIAVRVNEGGTAAIFPLSNNNGLGGYKTTDVVPVELTSFTAIAGAKGVTLKWSTATEVNSHMFVLERKSASAAWQTAGSVKAAGNSTENRSYSFVDAGLASGTYQYRIKAVDLDGSFEYSNSVEAAVGIPSAFALSQNYPNPFNPETKFSYQLPNDSKVVIELYSVSGEKVAELFNGNAAAGWHNVTVGAGLNLVSGMYVYRITAVDNTGKMFSDSKKMLMLK